MVQPASPGELASALAHASSQRLLTVIRGGGTKLEWGRPAAVDLVVSTARLSTPIEHRHGDLTVTAAAGVTLAQLNQTLARHRQWLPVESAFEAATIGGIVATNDAGPVRHRFGTPRDLLIGVTLALADGRIVKAGGHVVKNVAGYDLGKLVSGSFGSLAAIVDATFKLLPVPQASATVAVTYGDAEACAHDALAVTASQIEPIAVDVHAPDMVSGAARDARRGGGYRLLVRCASSAAATRAQVDAVRALVHGEAQTVTDEEERALWAEQIRAPWQHQGTVIRLSWLPARLAQVAHLLEELRGAVPGRIELRGRVGAGAGLVHIDAAPEVVIDAVTRLRGATSLVAHVVVLRAETAVRERLDVWGPPLPAVHVLRALKQSFDPAGILNAGRGPV